MRGWIGVDLDGTLARYDGWKGPEHIGEPIPEMVSRVKLWLAQGRTVKIFTARVAGVEGDDLQAVAAAIFQWSAEHIGEVLDITCIKDARMVELWDDRAVQVIPNTGRRADGLEG